MKEMPGTLQLTLALLKPDIAGNPRVAHSIENLVVKRKFLIVQRKSVRWNRENAAQFYKQHEGRFFHQRLVEFMSSGPTTALVLARENAIAEWRKLMGPTKVYQTRYSHPATIRGQIGLSDIRNTVHGSDSDESAIEEMGLFFPGFSVKNWIKNKATFFSNNEVVFDDITRTHRLLSDDSATNMTSKELARDTKSFDMSSQSAWLERYARKTDTLDWFVDYEKLQSHLVSMLDRNPSFKTVVDLGCGSSLLGPRLAELKPNLDVYCTDISSACLSTLATNSTCSNCTFLVSDACQRLPFDTESVDLLIDKGTSDALMRYEDGPSHVASMLQEAKRVLQKEGVLLQVTTDIPESRLDELSRLYDEEKTVSFVQLPYFSNDLPVYAYTIKFS